MKGKQAVLVGLITLTALNLIYLPTALATNGKSAQPRAIPDSPFTDATAKTNVNLVVELSAAGEQALLEEQYAAARDALAQALAIAQLQGDYPQIAHLLNQLGLSYQYLGEHERALDLHQQALVLWTELAAKEPELPRYQWQRANTWSYLMLTYQELGQYGQANEALIQATTIITQEVQQTRWNEITQLGTFEGDFIHQPTFPEAISAYRQQADTALSRTSERDSTDVFLYLEESVTALKNLGDTYSYLEQLPAAIAAYQEAVIVGHQGLALARQQSQREWEARSLVILGEAYRGMGLMHAAMMAYRQALLIYQELDDTETTYAIQQARILSRLGDLYQQWVYNLTDEPATLAIASYSQALAIYQKLNKSLEVAETLVQLHKAYPNTDISAARIENLEQSLNLYRSLDQDVRARQGEIEVLIELSMVYMYALQNPHKSLELLQEARQIAQFLDNPYLESNVLFHSAFYYRHPLKHQYDIAATHYQAALALARSIGDERLERMSLSFLGVTYRDAGAYQQAIETYFELQAVGERLGNFNASRSATSGLETVYLELGYTQGAIDIYTQTLADAQQRGDRHSEIALLSQLGNIYQERGEYEQALARYQEELAVLEAIGDPYGRRQYPLADIGQIYLTLGQPQAAITAYQQALAAAQTNENPVSWEIGYVFTQLAEAHLESGDIEETIATYQQLVDFTISTWGDSTDAAAEALLQLANAYQEFEQWSAAISAYQQIVSIGQALASDYWQIEGLIQLGIVYETVGDAQQSHEVLNQSLERITQASDRNLQVDSLIRISAVYDDLNDPQQVSRVLSQAIDTVYSSPPGTISLNVDALANQLIASGDSARAIDFYQRVLALNQYEEYRVGLMRQLAEIYKSNQQFQAALDIYQQVLVLSRESGSRLDEIATTIEIAMLFAEQDQPELAILHYKEAVNQIEIIRAELGTQPLELQQAYTRTVAETYRALADLLLEQGRIPEAQQVLDLLKLEELREFTDTTRAIWSSEKLQYTAIEQPVVDAHGSLIALGQKIYECRQIQCGELNRLREQQRTLTTAYENQVANFETAIARGERDDNQFQDPRDLSDGAYDLLQANPNALLIYPFVTEEKLWLLWASAGGSVGSIAIEDATQGELSRVVQQFGAQLKSPGDLAALKTTSYQLYQWLIQPLEAELEKNNIQQLIFVNDRVTRYIPMAALFDGDRYLVERYTISTVITPGTTDTDKTLARVDEAEALAVGLTQAVGEFSALPAVAVELDAIVRSDTDDQLGIYPGQVFLNEDFTLEVIQSNVEFKQILHIASHAEFAPSRPEDSFILLGNNQKLSIPEIETMQESLRDLHLVVLSACETALGGTTGDGTEIAGISSYFLAENRAETVIASLWAVNDTSTSLLMQRFYQLLATGELTKAEALRQAQLILLHEQGTEHQLAADRGIGVEATNTTVEMREGESFSHPYYWAPFILIGNGL